jgi:phospholipid-binding lipoprotein MlaA
MLPQRFRSIMPAAALLSVVSLGACASDKNEADSINDDPFESVNRVVWDADIALNDYLLTPVAKGYRWVAPEFVQTAVINALHNLKSPAIFANDLLEGNMKRAGQTLTRLWLNTLVGVGGLIDVAADQDIPFHDADFGATLGSWGVPSGPYLVLPLLGPSDPRYGIGMAVDSTVFDPFAIKMQAARIDSANYYRFGVDTISGAAQTVDQIEELRKSSLDFYAAVRSLYQQKRAADIATAKNPDAPALPDVHYDDVEPSGPVPSNPPADAGSAKAK